LQGRLKTLAELLLWHVPAGFLLKLLVNGFEIARQAAVALQLNAVLAFLDTNFAQMFSGHIPTVTDSTNGFNRRRNRPLTQRKTL
jgi:hypothetical protein